MMSDRERAAMTADDLDRIFIEWVTTEALHPWYILDKSNRDSWQSFLSRSLK